MQEERPTESTVKGARVALRLGLSLCSLLPMSEAGWAAVTAAPAVVSAPDLVTEPTVNLGGTSFYDGFGQFTPGFVLIDYARWEHLTSISDSKGNEVTAFRDPDIEALSNAFQFIWVTPLHVPHGAVGFMAIVPLVDLSSSFTQPGPNLRANGFGLGDLTWGPFYQSAPWAWGKQVLSYRVEIDILSPSGAFDRTKDINQSSGFWSINPYIAVTYLPSPGWEVTGRFYYLYNFSTDNIPHPPIIPGLPLRRGQAGQAAWVNFTASREIVKDFAVGLNGYYFQQFTDDRMDGVDLAHSRKNQLYLGPGAHWQPNRNNIFNLNLYVPATTHGVANGPQVNIQFIHPF